MDEFEQKWNHAEAAFEKHFGKAPNDLNAFLFVIGIQELGKGVIPFSKEEKQDLMHIATCKILSQSGYYEYTHTDEQGWPHFSIKTPLPHHKLGQQERLLQEHVVMYFEANGLM